MNRLLRQAMALVCLGCGLPASAQNAKQVRQFVSMIYAHETAASASVFAFEQVMTPALRQLVEQDRRGGDIGKLEADPLCGCQDSDGLDATVDQIEVRDRTHASATVALRFRDLSREHVRLDLLWTAEGWKVDDVHTHNFESLRKLLSTP